MGCRLSTVNLLFFFVSSITPYCCSDETLGDTVSQGQELRDWEHLDSANNVFRLKFFSVVGSQRRYLGIFYITPPKVAFSEDDKPAVWVANRDNPIPDASGRLMIDVNGTLRISYGGTNAIVFNSVPAVGSAIATLLDNGNLVLRELNSDGSVNRTLWQSFDYPTDTLLPGMKLGINFRTGHRWSLTSRISDAVPGSGSFTIGGDPNGTSQLIIWWQGDVYWTSGLWRNGTFDNALPLSVPTDHNNSIRFSYVSSGDEKYLMYSVDQNVSWIKYTIDKFGMILEGDVAGVISACGLQLSREAGCVKQILPNCRQADFWFEMKTGNILGEGYRFENNYNLSLFDCQEKCIANCSCAAYASINDNGTGCEIWDGGMEFLGDISQPRDIFVLVRRRERKLAKWIIVSVGGAAFISLLACLCFRRWKIKSRAYVSRTSRIEIKFLLTGMNAPVYKCSHMFNSGYKAKQRILTELGVAAGVAISNSKKRGHELQVFSFESVIAATDNFSVANTLGKGGFGPVYKGKLPDGQLVAIKRLSRSSGQGVVEFKNEILLIGKLQHNNLVKLLGCCIEEEEKILIYEYMPNKSLDFFLFSPSTSSFLGWNKRFNIIEGIAQGLLYLHKYSRLRIIHRDLKASNILLDDEWNPKISDFGLARIFEQDIFEANTRRVVGTYGYMPPEYAMAGTFSIKSDVFSFGVMLLEIISGKKNNSSYHLERPLNLIGWAWELWNQGRVLELLDPKIAESYRIDEVLRCIHVGLLCAQENPLDRPTMSDVVLMISNGTPPSSIPKQPAFYIGRSSIETRSNAMPKSFSLNTVTMSEMQAR